MLSILAITGFGDTFKDNPTTKPMINLFLQQTTLWIRSIANKASVMPSIDNRLVVAVFLTAKIKHNYATLN